jgi:class 3 adenylate cyclase
MQILIIDDEPGLGEIIEKYLTLHGFEVVNAEAGAKTNPRIAGQNQALLVFDPQAPGEDGLTLIRRLQERGKERTVRIHTVLRHPGRVAPSPRVTLQSKHRITRKIASIMAADVASYSRLVAENEEETLHLLSTYREIFYDFVDRYGGRVFNLAGDSVMSEFSSAVEAMRAALDIQEALRTHNLPHPPNRRLLFRIGITIADVVERQGELLGDGVNLAARLESLASPGGICVSRAVHEVVANKVSATFRDLGEKTVKNIPTPVHAYVVDWSGG